MIDSPDTFWVVCNTSLPIPDKYLINTYLLNPIPGKDRIVWIIMPIKLGTCWDVCNTPLPIRIKNLIPLWTMNLKLGTCWGVCNTPLHIPDKYLINTYLLNLTPDKDWIVHIWVYCIRPTNIHDHGQMIDPPDTFWVVCNTPLPIRVKNLIPIYWVYLKLGRFLGVCLCDQLHLSRKLLKFVGEHVKPAEDWMDMTNATQTSTSNS